MPDNKGDNMSDNTGDNMGEDEKTAETGQERTQAEEASPAPEAPKTGWWGRLRRKLSGQPKVHEEANVQDEPEAQDEPVGPQATEAPAAPQAQDLADETEESSETFKDSFEPASQAMSEPTQESSIESAAQSTTETSVEPAGELPAEESQAPKASEPQESFEPQYASEPVETAQELPERLSDEPSEIIADAQIEEGHAGDPRVADEFPGPEDASLAEEISQAEELSEEPSEDAAEPKLGWLRRLKRKLSATRSMLAGRLEQALSRVRKIDEEVLEELEEIMITSDLGVKTTNDILNKIRGQVASKELKDADALKKAIKARMIEMISVPLPPEPNVKPLVILMVGVNGVGKTTTIAKLARRYQSKGRKVVLAAGDTFRAAAVEQLTIWAGRLGIDIVSQPSGADPSAVVFDSLTAAKARGADVVLIDTAGRLHTKSNLMDELKKIKRVAGKAMEGAPHETVLVLDANTGQNAVNQAAQFDEAIGVDRLVVTKLDGTSKGGVIVSIIHERRLPVAFIGLGETYEDLRPFDPEAFVEAILGTD